jgi:hypothetical protein
MRTAGVLHTRLGASRTAAFRSLHTVGFPSLQLEAYPVDHNSTYCGALSRGLRPRSLQLRTPITGGARGVHSCPAGWALVRWDLPLAGRTHWVTTANFIGLLLLPRFRVYLGTSSALFGAELGREPSAGVTSPHERPMTQDCAADNCSGPVLSACDVLAQSPRSSQGCFDEGRRQESPT